VVLTSKRELILIALAKDGDLVVLRVADLKVENLSRSRALNKLTTHLEGGSNLTLNNLSVVGHSAVNDTLHFISGRSIVNVDREHILVHCLGATSPATNLHDMVHVLPIRLKKFSDSNSMSVRMLSHNLLLNRVVASDVQAD